MLLSSRKSFARRISESDTGHGFRGFFIRGNNLFDSRKGRASSLLHLRYNTRVVLAYAEVMVEFLNMKGLYDCLSSISRI